MIVIDLCSFSRGEVDIDIKPDKYIIFAKHGDQEFRQEIDLPPDVDIENTEENFKNGILEITLPRKKDKHKIKRVVESFRQKESR
jgi:HSP20 family molecular chaperone IbpA